MSKRKAADVLQPESSAPSSRNVLELFVRDQDAKTIRNVFIRTLQQSNSAALDNLLTAMEAAGFDFSSTRAVFALPKSLHCVRCHETYDPRKNTKTSCTTEHDSPEMWKQKTSRGSYMYHYSCCGEEVPGDDEEPEMGFCFVGKHTTNRIEVDYSSNNVRPCEKSEVCDFRDGDTDGSGEECDTGSDIVEVEGPNKDSRSVKRQRSN